MRNSKLMKLCAMATARCIACSKRGVVRCQHRAHVNNSSTFRRHSLNLRRHSRAATSAASKWAAPAALLALLPGSGADSRSMATAMSSRAELTLGPRWSSIAWMPKVWMTKSSSCTVTANERLEPYIVLNAYENAQL